MTTAQADTAFPDHLVTAVLVARDGATWLPRALAGLAAQTRQPDDVRAVDTESTDGSAQLLADALGSDRVVAAPADIGFGAAVARALADLPAPTGEEAGVRRRWVWLLHDDVEPRPGALAALLDVVDANASIAVAGPKVRGWNDPRLLLETGVTIARSGRRETGLERREQDQGQHDGVHTVLAVGTAGMLVRRDVWDGLGGLDPALPVLRDDIDFGWRANLAGHRVVCATEAVVHHAEAASRGRRPLSCAPDRYQRVDRQHAIYVLLANLPLLALPWSLLRLTGGTLLRMTGLLLGKLPGHAWDELLALAAVAGRPDRLIRARRRRRRTRLLPARAVRPLLASPGTGLRHLMETVSLLLGLRAGLEAGAGQHRALETGPVSEEAEDLPSGGSGRIRRVVTRPGVLLAFGLVLLALLACRDLLGAGRLMGGALLPAPDSAGDLWRTYTESWHPVGVGSPTPSPAYVAALAGVGTLLLGDASSAVDLVLLGAVPLAGVSAYLCLRSVVGSRPLRAWVAVTYALLPAVLGAVSAGRIGTAALAVLLPPTALFCARAVTAGRFTGSARARATRGAWTGALLLAVMAGFAPSAYLLAAVLGVVAVAAGWRDGRALVALLVILGAPVLLLLPWLTVPAHDPGVLLLEAGLPGPGLADPALPPIAALLLHPGGPGMYPVVISAGLVLAGLAALLRPDRRALVLAGWGAALVGMVAAVAGSRVHVFVPSLDRSVVVWPGPATLLAGAGLLLAAAVGADGLRGRVARSSFGWRQPATLLVVVAALAVPPAVGLWWLVVGAGDPLERRTPQLVPAFVEAEAARPAQPRTLVLRPLGPQRLGYALLRDDGPHTGDADIAPAADAAKGLDVAVADLASGRGGDAARELLPYGVRFVLMRPPLDQRLVRVVDTVPGLVRVSGPEGASIWRVAYPSGRLRLLPGGKVLASGPVGARTSVPAGDPERLASVADVADDGWEATLDGSALQATTYDDWSQAFELPTSGGTFQLWHTDRLHTALLWMQLVVLALVVLLAMPSARQGEDSDPPDPAAEARRELTGSRP